MKSSLGISNYLWFPKYTGLFLAFASVIPPAWNVLAFLSHLTAPTYLQDLMWIQGA